MKIVPIFAKEKKQGLFSIHLSGELEDELTKCLEHWLDPIYLHDFFTTHQNDLNSGYYGKTISIQQAISYTRDEAYQLFEKLNQLAISGTKSDNQSLSLAFKPLRNGDYSQKELQEEKAKSTIQKRWLRIYAIRIASNTFIVTGGAIKLVRKMNERPHLQRERQKLEEVRNYLYKEGILDKDDFEMLEF
jgi:hypothetical protein